MAVIRSWRRDVAALAMLLAVAALGACSTGGNSPFGSAAPVEREFMAAAVTWDLNRDGDVSCAEWKQYATGLFRDADANRDGILTAEEFAAMARSDRLFATAGLSYFDANADGRLSLPELTDKPNSAFVLLDKNNDCVLTRDERVNVTAPRDEPRQQGPPPPGRPTGGR